MKNYSGFLKLLLFCLILGGVGCGGLSSPGTDSLAADGLSDDAAADEVEITGNLTDVPDASTSKTLQKSIKLPGRMESEFSYEYEYEYCYEDETSYECGSIYASTYCGFEVYDEDYFADAEDDADAEEVADDTLAATTGSRFKSVIAYAMDADGVRYKARVKADGSFSLKVPVGKSIIMGFVRGTELLGILNYDTSDSSTGSSFHVSGSVTIINVGSITFEGNATARCSNNPMHEEDHDDDGVSDYDDEDFSYEVHYSCESTYEYTFESGTKDDDEGEDDEDDSEGDDEDDDEDEEDEDEDDDEDVD